MDTNSTDDPPDPPETPARSGGGAAPTDAAQEDAAQEDAAQEDAAQGRRSRRRPLVAGLALIVAAAAVASSVVYAVHSFGGATPASASSDRDSAVTAARTVGATMTTVKGGDPDATLKAWRGVITGGLADQYGKQEPQLRQRIEQSSSNVDSTVTNAALSEFNDAAGSAAALVFVDTTMTDPKAAAPSNSAAPSAQPGPTGKPAPSPAPGAASPQKQRLALTMSLKRTDQGWKASDLTPVDPATAGQ